MAKHIQKRYSMEFGKKEKVLNYATQTYQLSRPGKVGAVMSLIRKCQPKTIEEWENWYFQNAITEGKSSYPITKDSIEELGERLYEKIIGIVIPEWTEAFNQLTLQDCKNYIYNLTINRTFDGYLREKSVVEDNLYILFPTVRFEESDPELDHSGDIDFLGWVGNKAFGIQIKPVTAKANFGNYSPSERMQSSFREFTKQYGGKVFIVYSINEEIANQEVINQIGEEIRLLSQDSLNEVI
jgi:hypothetical protein